ncbi:MAG: hypothetical protein CMH57_05085 [Myxococcales bacterium]|nr:hypothetical protein [Myxococcales bacterium]
MIRVGLERLLHDEAYQDLTQGRAVGLLVNPTSVDVRLRHAVELAQEAGWNITRLFGPEHGVRGEAQDMEAVDVATDPLSGLPCVSLYGHDLESLKPDPAHLEGIDVLVIDLQDIGARYYTYIYTAAFCAEVCGELGIDVIVCDRPNPLGGEVVEGNVVLPEHRSFVGAYPLATRHGMTFGELMRYFERWCGLSCDLTVIPMEGWRRFMWYDDTLLPWVMPSPNMPTLDTAIVYPGQCLLEGTELSEGRGTTRPFELFGAPWLDAVALEERLTRRALPGCLWRQVSFKPTCRKHAETNCRGLQLHVTHRDAFRSLTASLAILQDILALHPDEFTWRSRAYEFVTDQLAIDLLLGDVALREALTRGDDVSEIVASMAQAREEFEAQRREVLLYG